VDPALGLRTDLIRSALETAPDAIVIADGAGTIVFANRQVEALFGYRPAEILGAKVEQLLPERLRGPHAAHRRRFAASPRVRPMGAGLELYGRRKDGSEFPVEISLSPIGESHLTTAAIRDVTERKRIEAELIAAREEANRANLAKSRFLATASHDLRQPVQALAMLNGILRRAVGDVHLTAAISQQEQAINAMSRLLGALLDMSKLESGAIRPEISSFRVDALFEEMRSEFYSVAASKGLSLEVHPEPVAVRSDRSLVEQVLRNLISNAIKYTRYGSVRLRSLDQGPLIRVEVLDTGIGIPPEQLSNIYDEFYRVPGVAEGSTEDSGYGLGLAIVRRIVRLLDLQLEVRSEVGKGSAFALMLPAGSGAPPRSFRRAPRAVSDATSVSQPRVLLVEDDPRVRDATQLLLRSENYQVTVVTTLAGALEAAGAPDSIDLLITDYHLGNGENGIQVIEALRARHGPSLKAVLVTGDTSSAMHELARQQQVRVVSKPVQVDELLTLLRQLSAGAD